MREITYSQNGEYQIPDISLEETRGTIGKYGICLLYTSIEKEEPELDIWAGKHYGPCDSFVSEHFTQPPKQYTDCLLYTSRCV